jgi:uncharacterized protein
MADIVTTRAIHSVAIAARRRPAALLGGHGRLLTIAADRPARGRPAVGRAAGELAARRLLAPVEPFASDRVGGRVRDLPTPDAMISAMTVASGLGNTSAYTRLTVPVVPGMARVMAATTPPVVLLGGEVGADADAAFENWRAALALPDVRGVVAGRPLLHPRDDDVAGAVDTAVGLCQAGG